MRIARGPLTGIALLSFAARGVLTGARAMQQPGTYCTGGATAVDQVLARRLSAPGRFDSRYYGFNYIPNSVVSPFSYLGAGQATPMVSDPATAFADLLGYTSPVTAGPQSRAALLDSLRPSVLDARHARKLQVPRLTRPREASGVSRVSSRERVCGWKPVRAVPC